MKARTIALLLVSLTWLACVAHAVLPMSAAYVVDKASVSLIETTDRQALEWKLAGFDKITGIRVQLQLHPTSPSAEEDKVPGAYMQGLSRTLGLDQAGVLLVYFADEDDWRIWFGDEIAPHFVGQPRTAKELTASGAIHDAKEALLNESRSAGETAFAQIQRTSGLSASVLKMKRVRAHADALLDLMFAKLFPE